MTTFWKITLGVGCGILFVAAALFVGCTALVGYGAHKANEADVTERLAAQHLKIEDVSGHMEGDYFKLVGRIRNEGTAPVTFVEVEVEMTDEAGTLLGVEKTYAIGGEGLGPGQDRAFDLMAYQPRQVARFEYRILP